MKTHRIPPAMPRADSPSSGSALRVLGMAIVASLCLGCVLGRYEALPQPIPLQLPPLPPTEQQITPAPGSESAVTIGDALITSETRFETWVPGRRLRRWVPMGKWVATHQHEGIPVYTHVDFFRSTVGAAIAGNDLVVDRFVRTRGGRQGYSYDGNGETLFDRAVVSDIWFLRYGGRVENLYRFEIVDRPNDSQSEVIQRMEVEETTLLEGFRVRGILIQALSPGARGMLQYRLDR